MKKILYLALIGIAFSFTSCTDGDPELDDCNEVFFSSFETLKDLESFEGYGYYRSDDVMWRMHRTSLIF